MSRRRSMPSIRSYSAIRSLDEAAACAPSVIYACRHLGREIRYGRRQLHRAGEDRARRSG
jgi:hypothetical protein